MKSKVATFILLCGILFFAANCRKNNSENQNNASNTEKYKADVAASWYNLLTEISRLTPYPPPPSIRIFAYSGLTLYESVVPGMPSYNSIYKHFTGLDIPFDKTKEYYWPAAANASLSRISSKLMANYGTPPLLALIQKLEDSLTQIFAISVAPEKLQSSIEFGRMVADKVYEWSTQDGTLTTSGALAVCPPYSPSGDPGVWVPTPPGFFPAAGACQRSLRTFIPGIVNAVMPPDPPIYSTDLTSDYYKMADKIYQLSLTRTTNDSMISEAWRDRLGMNFNTPAHILRLTSQIMLKEKLNLEEAAIIYAQQGIAMFDAIAASFASKFNYVLQRPITYIRNIMGKTTWNSIYPTPQHPSYPAVAPAAAAAGIVILEKKLGTSHNFIDSTQKGIYGSWNYSSFDELVKDVGKSRTHSGLNFEVSVREGISLGRKAGEKVDKIPFRK